MGDKWKSCSSSECPRTLPRVGHAWEGDRTGLPKARNRLFRWRLQSLSFHTVSPIKSHTELVTADHLIVTQNRVEWQAHLCDSGLDRKSGPTTRRLLYPCELSSLLVLSHPRQRPMTWQRLPWRPAVMLTVSDSELTYFHPSLTKYITYISLDLL